MTLDLYSSVTRQIIAALEAGTPPWVCPWRDQPCEMTPRNASTARRYRGINTLLLNLRMVASGYRRNAWLTFRQALSLGAHVRAGEQGTTVVFFKMHEVSDRALDVSEAESRVVPLLRSFTVFNIEQVDGMAVQDEAASATPWDACAQADALITGSCAVVRHGGARAFYAPGEDYIQLPAAQAFAVAQDYYATALHELTHWTGHPSRCNRPLGRRHGIEAYAFEELVAEMGSAFLTNHCGLPGHLQHASYIASWLEALRRDKRLVFAAATQAQRAADYLLSTSSYEPVISAAADALAA